MRFHVYYLYIWYGIIAVGSAGMIIDGSFTTIMFVGAVIDMLIPTVIYFAWRGYKSRQMEKLK